jgi:hypothetical protein
MRPAWEDWDMDIGDGKAAAPRRALPARVVRGTIRAPERKDDTKGEAYLKATFVTEEAGRTLTVTAMAFGKAATDLDGVLVEGQVALYGVFEEQVFRIISLARGGNARKAA